MSGSNPDPREDLPPGCAKFVGRAAAIILVIVAVSFGFKTWERHTTQEVMYSKLVQLIEDGRVQDVEIQPEHIVGDVAIGHEANASMGSTKQWKVYRGDADMELLETALRESGVSYSFVQDPWPVRLLEGLAGMVPFLLIMFVVMMIFSSKDGDGSGEGISGIFGVTKSPAVKAEKVKTRFSDVADNDAAKRELMDIVKFLRDPKQATRLGGRLPRGILLEGPPGTGKTLMARATAGEAGCSFFYVSGSDFVEMFVGVGPARVRRMIAAARKQAPSIIFIDEIDAIGGHRRGTSGGDSERNNTLNALLVGMDGFASDPEAPIVFIAATNRPDQLDPAVVRPGRFDKHVRVGLPHEKGRAAILQIHLRGVKHRMVPAELGDIIRLTAGMSGAGIEALVNEAALIAQRRGGSAVETRDFRKALHVLIAGNSRHGHRMSDADRRLVAIHEAGHAIVQAATGHADRVHHVSIIPTDRALGYNIVLPEDEGEVHVRTEVELLGEIAALLGGREAERLVLGHVANGATDDMRRATKLARQMVMHYGMGANRVGRYYDANERDWGDSQQERLDAEIERVLKAATDWAQAVLQLNQPLIEQMVAGLKQHDELDSAQLRHVLRGVNQPPSEPVLAIARDERVSA